VGQVGTGPGDPWAQCDTGYSDPGNATASQRHTPALKAQHKFPKGDRHSTQRVTHLGLPPAAKLAADRSARAPARQAVFSIALACEAAILPMIILGGERR